MNTTKVAGLYSHGPRKEGGFFVSYVFSGAVNTVNFTDKNNYQAFLQEFNLKG